MLLGGLWHGASWNFVIWGAFHGFGLVVWRLIGQWSDKRNEGGRFFFLGPKTTTILRVFITFHFVTVLWVFFGAKTLDQAVAVFDQLFAFTPGAPNLDLAIIGVLIGGFLIHWAPMRWHYAVQNGFIRAPWWLQALIVVGAMYLMYFIAHGKPRPFIYFQF